MLFEIPPVYPEGFSYHPEFLSDDEHVNLISLIQNHSLHPMIFQGYEAKRKVASFGVDYDFQSRRAMTGTPIPKAFLPLIERVAIALKVETSEIKELLLTEYPIGSVINWHRDAPPFDKIAGISLRSPCTFKFRPYNKESRTRKSIISLTVEPRSLYLMTGNSRSDWEHSTAPVTNVRYSITLRTMK